jgi:hypothetical protein
MDADNSPVRRAAPAQGGTVEPANRAPVAIARFPDAGQAAASATRCAIRSPRSRTARTPSPRCWRKAEQLGSTRFVAVAEDGKRTPIQKVDGEWQRGQQRPAAPERPLDPVPARDEVPEARRTSSRCPGPPRRTAQPEQADAKAIAKIDAQAERAALVRASKPR